MSVQAKTRNHWGFSRAFPGQPGLCPYQAVLVRRGANPQLNKERIKPLKGRGILQERTEETEMAGIGLPNTGQGTEVNRRWEGIAADSPERS